MRHRLEAMYAHMEARRSVRNFSPDPVPMKVLERAVHIAGTAPSGAHKQPWSFCIVTDSDLRKRIRTAVEEEEYRSYHGRMSQKWLDDLEPLGTDAKARAEADPADDQVGVGQPNALLEAHRAHLTTRRRVDQFAPPARARSATHRLQ